MHLYLSVGDTHPATEGRAASRVILEPSEEGGLTPPGPPAPQTKGAIVGSNKIYNRENLVGPFWVHTLLGPRPPSLLSSNVSLPPPAPHAMRCLQQGCRAVQLLPQSLKRVGLCPFERGWKSAVSHGHRLLSSSRRRLQRWCASDRANLWLTDHGEGGGGWPSEGNSLRLPKASEQLCCNDQPLGFSFFFLR